ncbi:81113938-0f9c-4319-852d-3a8b1141a064 [Thermothielavioides terrestris]|uniref:81113938-0f9c-4319-852d-3a8b1141a064 n=1 Tax=Thermothielavioides terrestris TaxID=2587410 RepID=A0A3S4C8X4_9PEZI|nr:81113938-0f9c-4319-852d-3a8b1141a064 [Thermothielavioides terrestris]
MSITWASGFSAAGDPVSRFAAPHGREDVWLDDGKYLIKKGGRAMMPATLQHQSREVWGPDVDEFDHRQFMMKFMMKPGETRPNPVAFRGFGLGIDARC